MQQDAQLDGEKIKEFLKGNFRTREWLAVELGISGSQLNRMLAGVVPKARTMEALAKLMDCKETDLLTRGAKTA